MDYETSPSNRENLRKFSVILRNLFDVPRTGPFPVLEALDKLCDVFDNCNYLIVEDDYLPNNTMARCIQNEYGGYTIEIKEYVYRGAYEKQIGAYLGFICHEICHIFLFHIGFTPIHGRKFEDGKTPAYRSVEWQAKALCLETMVPYEESKYKSREEIIKDYHVSGKFADYRMKI